MEKINDLKIKTKLFLIVAINAFFLLAIGTCAFVGLTNINQGKEEIVINANAIYSQMTADMMHDALRADVYNSLLVDKRDPAQVEIVKNDLAEHAENFRQSLKEVETLRVDQEIREAVAATKMPLENYIRMSESIADEALKVDSASMASAIGRLPKYKQTFDVLAVNMEQLSELISKSSEKKRETANRIQLESKILVCSITLLAILIAAVVSVKITNALVTPILATKTTIQNLSLGMLPNQALQIGKDEVGEMANALNVLVTNLENVKNFSLEVGSGKFDTQISVFNNQGELGTSLAGMRESLQKVAEEDQKRNWSVGGMAQIGDILRKTNDNAEKLLHEVNVFLIKYLNANQGGLFVVDDQGPEICLRLVACYAYEKNKFIQKQVRIGEGLVGQCAQEGETIYLTDVPQNYISITSGLGGANPGCIVLVPLKINGQVQGVIEIASFHPFGKHEMEFLDKIAEGIASAISRVKVNERTMLLLEQSQQQTEEMRAQEEEMRQNLEELAATQEEMTRKEVEYLRLIEELKTN